MLSDGSVKLMNYTHTHTHLPSSSSQSRKVNKACSLLSESPRYMSRGSRENMKLACREFGELGYMRARMATLRQSHSSAKCFCVSYLAPSSVFVPRETEKEGNGTYW